MGKKHNDWNKKILPKNYESYFTMRKVLFSLEEHVRWENINGGTLEQKREMPILEPGKASKSEDFIA